MLVMWRDATFLNSPGFAHRYHLPRDGGTGQLWHPVAACNRRIQLDEDNTADHQDNPLLCNRCRVIIAAALLASQQQKSEPANVTIGGRYEYVKDQQQKEGM